MGTPKLCALAMAVIVLWFLLLVNGFVDSEGRRRSLEWQIINRNNFSSEIQLHQHVLLMVTVPWSGESRSLMKEIVKLAADKSKVVNQLKLMIIYRNTDKMLADLLGATQGISLFCYHHSVAYRYRGRLRAQNILSSVYHLMSLQPEEMLLKRLNTPLDLQMFLQSTDKAVLLLEFCGWTTGLLAKQNEEIFGKILDGDGAGTLPFGKNTNQKGLRDEKLTCGMEKGPSDFPWQSEFLLANASYPVLEVENKTDGIGASCTVEEFRHYETFFTKFTTIARDYFLPPEKQRFGLISTRSLLSSLGVGNPDKWLLMLRFSGCPNCSIIFKEGDDLKNALLVHSSHVIELEGDGHDLDPALPENGPSVILFVDRSSDSSKIRKKSKQALKVFRQVAYTMKGKTGVYSRSLPVQVFHTKKSKSISSKSDHLMHQVMQAPGTLKFKDKMAFVITNEGADVHGTSPYDILAQFLQQKNPGLQVKERKLSFLAKEVGFQLLSDDIEVKISEILPSEKENGQPNEAPASLNLEMLAKSNSVDIDSHSNHLDTVTVSTMGQEEEPGTEYATSNNANSHIDSVELAREPTDGEFESMERVQVLDDGNAGKRERSFTNLEDQKDHTRAFEGSFFFSDGGFRFRSILASDTKIPTAVILDPALQKHYIFPREMDFNYFSLLNFVNEYLNGSLPSYQRSEFVMAGPKNTPRPPFVNLDFHEADSVPRVTANTFSEMVLGFNRCGQSHEASCMGTQKGDRAWKKDVLVLFSNSWCGFCQRMELVVREVHRAIKGYTSMLHVHGEKENKEPMPSQDNLEGVLLDEFLSIFRIDCSLNDCRLLLKSMGQGDFYPALLLFPAEKTNPISYEGDASVNNIFEFLATHGSISGHLNGKEGILWSKAWKGGKSMNPSYDLSSSSSLDQTRTETSERHGFVLNSTQTEADEEQLAGLRILNNLESDDQNITVGSFLIATDKLLNAPPFDNSTILMVKVDRGVGFHGLIVSKPIDWSILPGLDKELELLKLVPLSYGGPVMIDSMPFVSLARHATNKGYSEVVPGFYFGDQLATLQAIETIRLGDLSGSNFWFFLGYSSWGWDQLFSEIRKGAWLIDNYQAEHLDWPRV